MARRYWLGFTALAALPGIAFGQAVPTGSTPGPVEREVNPAATEALPQPAAAQPTAPIVVRGSLERKSSWRRAEGEHVIVYSNGSEKDLKRLTANLDREYYLLSRIFGRDDKPDETVKLRVTLIGGPDFVRSMRLRNTRSEEGPFAAPFAVQRYYDPRETGVVLAVGRSDQQIPVGGEGDDLADLDAAADDALSALDGDAAFYADPISSGGRFGSGAQGPQIALRSWESLVYSAFAQHYMMTFHPAGYPRWYLDGIGALFSTLHVAKDGSIEYGRTPEGFGPILNGYPAVDAGAVLSGRYLDSRKPGAWTPYHAWVLVHYFFFGDLPPERRVAFVKYMSAIAGGAPNAEAAAVFGDLDALTAEVKRYAEGKTYFYRMQPPADPSEPLIERLTVSDAALLKARIELGARLDLPPPAAAGASAKEAARADRARADAIKRRDGFLANLREDVAKLPWNESALLLLAEAECRTANWQGCTDAAGRILAKEPGNAGGLSWRADAQLGQALAQAGPERDAAISAARRSIGAANAADNEALEPLLDYFRSYVQAGKPAPQIALLGMLKVIKRVPAAPGPRLELARELFRQGMTEEARRILLPVAAGPYDSPERTAAVALLAEHPAPAK